MTQQHRVGLVGTGAVAHAHVRGYRSVVGARAAVTAACDPRAEVLDRFCDEYGIAHRFADAAAMMASGEVDIAVVLTPPKVREEVIAPALAHGVHLLVEKPFAESAAAAVDFVQRAEQASIRLAVSQNFRWFPEHQWMKRRLADGDLGGLRFVEHRSFQNRPQPPGVWRAEESRLEMAIFSVHLIDRIQWMARVAPVAVAAVTRRDPAAGIPGEQFTSLIVQFDGGVVGQMTSSWMSKTLPTNELRADLERGSVAVRRERPMSGPAYGRAQVEGGPLIEVDFPESDEDRHAPRTYGHSLLELVEAIDEKREPEHSGRDNLRTMAIMDAAYLSAARGGALVTVDEVLGGYALPHDEAGVTS